MKTLSLYKSTDSLPQVRVLLDADVVLELFINRSPFVEEAEELQQLLVNLENSYLIEVYITDKCLRRICLELGENDIELGEKAVAYVKTKLNLKAIGIDQNLREQARTSPLRDFDSAEEVACAIAINLDAIITQNPQNFDGATLPIWSVANLLERISLEKNLEKQCQQHNLYYLTKHLQGSLAAFTYFVGHGTRKEPDILDFIKISGETHVSYSSVILFLGCCSSVSNIEVAKGRLGFLSFESKQYISTEQYAYLINSNPENQLKKSISYRVFLKALKKFLKNNKTDEYSNNNDFDSDYYE